MKVEEIKETDPGEEEESCCLNLNEEEDEVQANLTEALSLLEDCVILFETLADPTFNAKWSKTPKFLTHNALKLRAECRALLDQYDLSSI